MANDNCLDGIACPKCGSEGPFWITVHTTALVSDEGVEDHGQMEWDAASFIRCTECHHGGDYCDFEEPPSPIEQLVEEVGDDV